MAKQVINTGTANDDGTGDTFRVAFTKINLNCDELYIHANTVGNPHGTTPAQIGAIALTAANTVATANQLLYLNGSAQLPASITGNANTATALSSSRTFTITTDATGTVSSDLTSGFTIALTLANTGVAASTYRSVTVDPKGRVTGGTNPTTVAAYGLTDAVDTTSTQTISGAKTFTANTTVGAILTSTLTANGVATFNSNVVMNNPATINSTLTHNGLVMTAVTSIDQLYTAVCSLTLSTSWQDTGIKASNLTTGSYIAQILVNDSAVGGGEITEIYTGMMSWYGSDTDSTVTEEVVLHRAGVNPGAGQIFIRVQETVTADVNDLKLQITGVTNNSGASNYTFKFRRMI